MRISNKKGFSLKKRLYLLLVCLLPLTVLIVYLLMFISSISSEYDQIVGKITKVNDYNMTFKEDIDYENEKNLIDDELLDSFDILQLISALDDEFDVSIPASMIVPENFNSVEALWNMVQELMD